MTKSEYKELLQRFKDQTRFINKATLDDLVEETPEEQEARIKHLLKPENYGEFFNYYFGKDTPLPLADSDCAWFQKAVYKELYNDAYRTIFNLIFRGGAKSTHANLGYPFALKQSGKSSFFLVVGANEVRAAMLLQDLQVQFESNNRIIKDFGLQKSYGNWADGLFETTDRCTFMSLGIDQPFRGLRQNGVRLEYASIDDIEDRKRSMNTVLTAEYVDKVTGDIQGAFSKRSERTIINNNYFTDTGFIAGLLKKKGFNIKKLDTKRNFVKKEKYSSIYLVNLTTKYYEAIEADPEGAWEPSWTERYTREDCLRKIEQYKNDKATLSNEFYNTPVKVGKLFKPEAIKWVDPKPLNQYDLLVGFWDFSYTATGDTKAFALIGCTETEYTLLDIFCRNCDISDALYYHFTNTVKWLRKNASFISYYDANVAQKAVYEPILIHAAKKYRSIAIPLQTHNASEKYTKISTTLQGAFGAGKFFFSRKLEEHPDWGEASHQLFSFEKGSKVHDDFPDALAEALIQAQLIFAVDTEDEDHEPIIKRKERGGY